MKTKIVNYRHGDLVLIGTEEIPEGMKETKTENIMRGSNNNKHTFKGGKIYLEKQEKKYIIGYLKAEKCTLYHVEHGEEIKGKKLKEAKIKDGIYELRYQMEHTNKTMKRVVD